MLTLALHAAVAVASNDGVVVGLSAAAGSVVGGVAFGAAGFGIGLATCRNEGECWDWQVGAIVGAVGGTVAGELVGAGLASHAVGRRSTPSVLGGACAFGAGALAVTAGGLLESDPLAIGGFVGAAVLAPVVSGIAAGSARELAKVTVTPTWNGSVGIALTYRGL